MTSQPAASQLHRASHKLEQLADQTRPAADCRDAATIRHYDDTRALARRAELAAFVLDHNDLVDQLVMQIGLFTEAYAQITTGRLVGEHERDLADSLIARALHLRHDLTTHWPTLRAATTRIAAQATETLAR